MKGRKGTNERDEDDEKLGRAMRSGGYRTNCSQGGEPCWHGVALSVVLTSTVRAGHDGICHFSGGADTARITYLEKEIRNENDQIQLWFKR